jgi:hypothetical protein
MVRIERVNVTPLMASEMLASNSRNRPISRGHVLKLAESMRRGEWDFNGTTIKVASSGRLLDGQHRLTACVEAEAPFDTLVVYGLEDESFASIDQAAKGRKVSDVLSIESGANMKNVAAVIFALYQLRRFGGFVGASAEASAGFSAAVAREILHKHPGLIASVAASNSATLWRNAYCSCLHYVFGIVDPDMASDFVSVLRDGSPEVRRPFNIFREGLIRLRNTSAAPNRRDAAARAIKAFNYELSGKPVSILTWRSNEDFPVISGLDYDSI